MPGQNLMRRKYLCWFIGAGLLLIFSVSGCEKPNQESTPAPGNTGAAPTLAAINSPAPSSAWTAAPTTNPNSTEPPIPTGSYFFDDFNYPDQQTMIANGWIIREAVGWPGMPGANWPKENISPLGDPDQPGNFLVRLTASTDGSAAGTTQSQLCHQRKYLEGTYAARIRFSDEPDVGPDGDQIVETFYMISPLVTPLDPNYSEMDNEYLPNGGWNYNPLTMAFTTWETAQLEPWIADNASDNREGSLAGWHTLVMQVVGSDVYYLLDGQLAAHHWGKYFPEVPMSINFNLWFVNGGLIKSQELRRYSEYVDWVYFEKDQRLTPPEIDDRVNALRAASLVFHDTVPAWDPPLPSPCNF